MLFLITYFPEGPLLRRFFPCNLQNLCYDNANKKYNNIRGFELHIKKSIDYLISDFFLLCSRHTNGWFGRSIFFLFSCCFVLGDDQSVLEIVTIMPFLPFTRHKIFMVLIIWSKNSIRVSVGIFYSCSERRDYFKKKIALEQRIHQMSTVTDDDMGKCSMNGKNKNQNCHQQL